MCEIERDENARHAGKFNEAAEKGAEKPVAGNKSSKGGESQILQDRAWQVQFHSTQAIST